MSIISGSNSIYELASKHQQMMMREINSTDENQTIPHRADVDDTGSRSFLLKFDNLYPLIQQLLVKLKMNDVGVDNLSIDAYVNEKIDEAEATRQLMGVVSIVDFDARATKTLFNQLITNVNGFTNNIFYRYYLLREIYSNFSNAGKEGVNLRETIGKEMDNLAPDIQKMQHEEVESKNSYLTLKKIDNSIASLVSALYSNISGLFNILSVKSNYVNWANEIERYIWEAFLSDFKRTFSDLIDISKYSAIQPYIKMMNKVLDIYGKMSNLIDDMKRIRH